MQNFDNLETELQGKIHSLQKQLISLQPGCIAVSGGLDSRFLASLARLWRLDYMTIFFSGPHLAAFEKKFALSFLKNLQLPSTILHIDPLEVSEVAHNCKDRCYYCKIHLFTQARQEAWVSGFANILEGSHTSDQNEYRPGHQSLQQLGIKSPLQTAGFTKEDIRICARSLGMPAPDQPSRPCLLTRFPYGFLITSKSLSEIAHAEECLYRLGLRDFRIRVTRIHEWSLQISWHEKQRWSDSQTLLKSTLSQLGSRISGPFFVKQLSGYFDHSQTEKQQQEQNDSTDNPLRK